MQKEVSVLESEAGHVLRQSNFCQSLLEKVKRGEVLVLLPTLDLRAPNSESVVHVPGFCVACGEMLATPDIVVVYTLACGHGYHPLCFAHWVEIESECAGEYCERKIPKSAQTLLLNKGMLSIYLAPKHVFSLVFY